MDIKQKYREQFNKDVYSDDCCMQPTSSYSDEYVRWLEEQVKKCSIPAVVGRSKQLICQCDEPADNASPNGTIFCENCGLNTWAD